MALPQIKTDQIKALFEKETGISQDEIQDPESIGSCFPASYQGQIQTMDRTFTFWFTHEARAKKGSFTEEK